MFAVCRITPRRDSDRACVPQHGKRRRRPRLLRFTHAGGRGRARARLRVHLARRIGASPPGLRCAARERRLTPPSAFAKLGVAAVSAESWSCVPCRSGGIGRRAWFRSTYSQGCGGSSPFFGTRAFIINDLLPRRPPRCPQESKFGVRRGVHLRRFFCANFLRDGQSRSCGAQWTAARDSPSSTCSGKSK